MMSRAPLGRLLRKLVVTSALVGASAGAAAQEITGVLLGKGADPISQTEVVLCEESAVERQAEQVQPVLTQSATKEAIGRVWMQLQQAETERADAEPAQDGGAAVELLDENCYVGITGKDGAFRIDLPAGQYHIFTEAHDGGVATGSLDVLEDEQIFLRLRAN